jgi:L-amino acid N-acyltransferase YncA
MPPPPFAITPLDPADWPAVRRIYREGMATGLATFETEAPEWEAWDRARLSVGRLAARTGDGVIGWAALSPVSARAAYRGVAEVMVYVTETARGRGVGRALLAALVGASEATGLWTLQASILAQNHASLALHESAGFRAVGLRERIGWRDGRWHDIVLMERRSDVVGV